MKNILANMILFLSILRWLGMYNFEPVIQTGISLFITSSSIYIDNDFLFSKSRLYNYISQNIRKITESSLLLTDTYFNTFYGCRIILSLRFLELLYIIYPIIIFAWNNKSIVYNMVRLYTGIYKPAPVVTTKTKRKPID